MYGFVPNPGSVNTRLLLLTPAYAIDAPAIHAAGVQEGRAAMLREVVEWLRSTDTASIAWQFKGEHGLADAIEARFPSEGTT